MLRQLETIRGEQPIFSADADFYGFDTGSNAVLGVVRERKDQRLTALFNFSEEPQTLHLRGRATDLITGRTVDLSSLELPGYGFLWGLSEIPASV